MTLITTGWVGGAPCADGPQWDDLQITAGTARGAEPNEFERLVRLVRRNERIQAELGALREQLRRAWAYLATPGGNPALAEAQLDRLRRRRSALLADLRANRVEARELLGTEAPGAGEGAGEESD